MKHHILHSLWLCLLLVISTLGSAQKHTFAIGDGAFLLDDKPFVIKSAELHYPRIPAPYWRHRLQMCKALGMNTVCLYIFWNIHEPQPDNFDFEGQNDVAQFCRIAQEEGLWVIVRPGPYVCAEWEMGGLPWWLLRHEGVTLRDDDDPYFLERVAIFEREVGKQLAPLTIENGGPILMVQVENEYGSYAEDKAYVSKVRDTLKSVGFDKTTLFQCDWSSNFTKNGLDDLVWTLNFGTGADVDAQFKKLRELRPNAPLMCSEYWSGWFDKWGARHETRSADKMVAGIGQMLDRGISFSLYMTHGGTSFGHWAGANSPGFAPDVTSYDYDAPIDEQGRPTDKYYALRNLLAKYHNGKLPSVPRPIAVMNTDTIRFDAYAPLSAGVSRVVNSPAVQTFEDLNMGWGALLYETTLPSLDGDATLSLRDLHDYAIVSIDGREVGRANRVVGQQVVRLGKVRKGQRLSILVEAMGRINFGRAIADHKGITDAAILSGEIDGHLVSFDLRGWQISTLPDSYDQIAKALSKAVKVDQQNLSAGYYRATFSLRKTDDTFIDCSLLGKGQLYVNGHPIGRYWSIGPQQTLYVPGCWLRKGQNEIVVADVVGPRDAKVWGAKTPELNKLQTDTDPTMTHGNGRRPDLRRLKVAASHTLPAGNGAKSIMLDSPCKGRFVVFEILSSHDGNPPAVAEIYAIGTDGKRIDRNSWKVIYVSDEDTKTGNNMGVKAFDLQESTFWQTLRNVKDSHLMVVDMSAVYDISTIELVPRAESGTPGAPKDVKIYVY